MSPRRNWDSPTPLPASECAPTPLVGGGGAHSPGVGVGKSQFRRLEKKFSTLCLLCGDHVIPYLVGGSVDGLLGGRGGMHSRHQTLQDSKVVIDHLSAGGKSHVLAIHWRFWGGVSLVSYMVVGGMIWWISIGGKNVSKRPVPVPHNFNLPVPDRYRTGRAVCPNPWHFGTDPDPLIRIHLNNGSGSCSFRK